MRWWECGEIVLGRLGTACGNVMKIVAVISLATGAAVWVVQEIPQMPKQAVARAGEDLSFNERLTSLRMQATASINHLATIRHATATMSNLRAAGASQTNGFPILKQ